MFVSDRFQLGWQLLYCTQVRKVVQVMSDCFSSTAFCKWQLHVSVETVDSSEDSPHLVLLIIIKMMGVKPIYSFWWFSTSSNRGKCKTTLDTNLWDIHAKRHFLLKTWESNPQQRATKSTEIYRLGLFSSCQFDFCLWNQYLTGITPNPRSSWLLLMALRSAYRTW